MVDVGRKQFFISLELKCSGLIGGVKTRGCIQDVETETSVCFISSFIQPVGGFPFLFN